MMSLLQLITSRGGDDGRMERITEEEERGSAAEEGQKKEAEPVCFPVRL